MYTENGSIVMYGIGTLTPTVQLIHLSGAIRPHWFFGNSETKIVIHSATRQIIIDR